MDVCELQTVPCSRMIAAEHGKTETETDSRICHHRYRCIIKSRLKSFPKIYCKNIFKAPRQDAVENRTLFEISPQYHIDQATDSLHSVLMNFQWPTKDLYANLHKVHAMFLPLNHQFPQLISDFTFLTVAIRHVFLLLWSAQPTEVNVYCLSSWTKYLSLFQVNIVFLRGKLHSCF